MPRLRNVQTGAILSCDDEVAARLGSEWVPAEPAKQAEKKAQRATSRKQD